MAEPKLTTAQITSVVRKRWSVDKAVIVEEAPEDAGRQGRKIDLLVINCWQSQGLAVEAVEVKASTTDLRREINDPSKADFWWRHSDRFWLATTPKVYAASRDGIPDTWGIIVVNGDKCRVQRQAPKTPREPWPWSTTVGVTRALAGNSWSALNQQFAEGRSAGLKEGRAQVERETGDAFIRRELEELRGRVAAFEDASGITIDGWSAGEVGKMVHALVLHRPDRRINVIEDEADRHVRFAKRLRDAAAELASPTHGSDEETPSEEDSQTGDQEEGRDTPA